MRQLLGNAALIGCCLVIAFLMVAALAGAFYRGPDRQVRGFDAGGRRS